MENNILILSLMSGVNILCSVEETQGAYICKDVLEIVSEVNPETHQLDMGLVPFMPYSDPEGGLAIPTNMALIAIPSAELKKYYAERFSLVYTPPTKKIILA